MIIDNKKLHSILQELPTDLMTPLYEMASVIGQIRSGSGNIDFGKLHTSSLFMKTNYPDMYDDLESLATVIADNKVIDQINLDGVKMLLNRK
jgi:hypothetical protein